MRTLIPMTICRKLKFNFTACDTDTEVTHGGHDDLAKIRYNASKINNFTSKEIGI